MKFSPDWFYKNKNSFGLFPVRFLREKKVIALSLGLVLATKGFAATIDWNVGEGNWNLGANWAGSNVPTGDDTARINNGGLVRVTESATASGLTLGTTGGLNNRLEINTGVTLTTNGANGNIGNSANQYGAVKVSGTWLLNGRDLYAGGSGTGVLTIDAGASVTSGSGGIGQSSGSVGTAEVFGTWISTGGMTVGNSGSGTLTIGSEGSITSSGATIGGAGSGTGSASVWGAWNHSGGNLVVGNNGTGTLTIEDGGTVTGINANPINIGAQSGSSGYVYIRDGGILNESNGGAFTVGSSGRGEVSVDAGGLLSTANANVGYNLGSTGMVSVSGTWNASFLYVAARGSGADAGTGTLVIENGGKVFSGAAYLGGVGGNNATTQGSGNVTVKDGGTWEASSSLLIGISAYGGMTVESGGMVKSTSGSIGSQAGGTGAVSVGGAWEIAGTGNDISVGHAGKGMLTINDGGEVTNRIGYIGRESGAVGSVTVGSGGLWANSAQIMVGNSGQGTLLIDEGGSVTSVGDSLLGNVLTGAGAVTVRGTWTNSGDITVGNSGQGTLSLGAGGLVNVNGGTGTVHLARNNNAAIGTLNVGGSVQAGIPAAAEEAGVLNAVAVTGRTGATITPLLNFNHTDTNYVFENVQGDGIIIQNNVKVAAYAGTTVLTAASIYAGGTEVIGGTLVLNNTAGSATGSGAVRISSGGTLRGVGSVAGNVNLQADGVLGAGYINTGTLTAGSLLWNESGEISLRLGGSQVNSDSLAILGLLGKGGDGSFIFRFSDGMGGPVDGFTYTLVSFGSLDSGWEVSDFGFAYSGGVSGFSGLFNVNEVARTVEFTVNVIPEPAVAGLLAVTGLLVMTFRRRIH